MAGGLGELYRMPLPQHVMGAGKEPPDVVRVYVQVDERMRFRCRSENDVVREFKPRVSLELGDRALTATTKGTHSPRRFVRMVIFARCDPPEVVRFPMKEVSAESKGTASR
jgi:hypothetical protein